MIVADPLFYLVAVPAVIMTGISKSGFGGAVGSLAVPLMSLVIAPPQAVAIMLPILLVMDAMGLVAFRGQVSHAILRVALPSGLLGIGVGWLLFRHIDARWVSLLIGVEAIVFAVQRLLEGQRAWTGPPRPLRGPAAAFWSALSGFTSFVSHAGGPPMMQLMMPLKLDHRIFVGTLAWFFAAINVSKLLPYAHLGLFDGANFATSLALMPVVPVGYLIGLRLLRWMQPAVFVRVATIGLLLTGIKLCWDASGLGV
ncbi:MAG TPA: sulfite exporter TauE/SafE family protein [Quisquiliibacterium sp.]|nr:sulfite exporter TauE/SafE family protein [Quisquiliibacterium sp.]HQN13514.1 sulfite exporter TauE/SafE family protein [Quisquiliibacterium sp.]HQP65630.1 sulfite exporter TauE/SafE family protein [Quisquiliibacterium sp.]